MAPHRSDVFISSVIRKLQWTFKLHVRHDLRVFPMYFLYSDFIEKPIFPPQPRVKTFCDIYLFFNAQIENTHKTGG